MRLTFPSDIHKCITVHIRNGERLENLIHFLKDFIYFTERERAHMRASGGTEREGEGKNLK